MQKTRLMTSFRHGVRSHPYIMSAKFWTFSDPPTTHYVSIDAVLKFSKNCHFLNSPIQLFCWYNKGMVPNDKLRKNGKLSQISSEGLQVLKFPVKGLKSYHLSVSIAFNNSRQIQIRSIISWFSSFHNRVAADGQSHGLRSKSKPTTQLMILF